MKGLNWIPSNFHYESFCTHDSKTPIKSVTTKNRYFISIKKKSILIELNKEGMKNYEFPIARSFQAEAEWLSAGIILQKEWVAGY